MLQTLEVEYRPEAAVLWLSRPETWNALEPALIGELTAALEAVGRDPAVRAVVLAGRGPAFCADAVPTRLGPLADASPAQRDAFRNAYADMLHKLYTCPKPTIARLHGACMGSGMGLAAACDIAIASSRASFAVAETRLGRVPHVIAPYVERAMTARQATRWLLTGETFSASEAWRIGFVHDLCEPEALDQRIWALVDSFTLAAPEAVSITKALLHTLPRPAGSGVTRGPDASGGTAGNGGAP